jgi:alkylation response protein AidB-like acyl-CoA dehydrogenase
MDFSLTESERELVELCRTFAQKEIATRAPLAWEEERCPTDLLREMGELGLLGMLIPEQWGGIGMSTVGFVAAMEQIGLADQSVAAAWQAHVSHRLHRESPGRTGCTRQGHEPSALVTSPWQ